MIWLAIACLLLMAFIVALPPLLKAPATASDAKSLGVYRDQLKEIDNDAERGLISAAEADAARIEIKRRILALPAETPAPIVAPSRRNAVVLAALITAVAFALYLPHGKPSLPDKPYDAAAEQTAETTEVLAEVEAMVAKLAARLKTQPDDAKGWRMLGWSYVQLGRLTDGIEALGRAIALDPNNAALRSQYGEALVQAADGKVTPDAKAAFAEALKRDAKDPRARFYNGLALVQEGKDREAFDLWVTIIKDGPADAQWMPGLRAQATELAARLKLPPTAVP